MAVKRVIKLLGEPIQTEEDKVYTGNTITPGMILSHHSSGDLVPHATAAGIWNREVAMHREEGVGSTFGTSNDIDSDYVAGETVKVGCFPPGTRFNALLKSGENIAKGDYLESAAGGYLRKYGSGVRLAYAREAIDNSAGLTPARLRVTVV
jgi:hypothetical protein